jgi:hypothetical protein
MASRANASALRDLVQMQGRAKFKRAQLLNLGFFEFHMLACDWIILVEDNLLGRSARIFLCDVKKSGSRRREQLDFLGDGFGHEKSVLLGLVPDEKAAHYSRSFYCQGLPWLSASMSRLKLPFR